MVFCGQCGLQIAAGHLRCPRCGTTVEEAKATEETSHANDYTVAGQSIAHLPQTTPVTPSKPGQPLILRPGNTANSYHSYDATSMVEAPPSTTAEQHMGTHYPASGLYPTQQANYPNYTQPGGHYASASQMSTVAQQTNSNRQNDNAILRVAGLIIALFGILLLLSAVFLVVMQQSGRI